MTFFRKHRAPDKPTRKAARAAFDMQRPLDQDAPLAERKKPRRWHEDEIPDFGEKK